ncbi:MAG: FAD-dependent monooxygenase [Deltaproteobacteria bacterium]|nr:FAD-dependent monooxygenase [Deltaproteobacteria bacterium]
MSWKNLNSGASALDYSAIIVGGGPAGISTWLHLQKYAPQLAESSIVIEKAIFPRDKLCGGGVCIWATDVLTKLKVDVLTSLKVDNNVPSLSVSDLEFRFGKEIDRLHQPNYFRFVKRQDFDHALAKAAVNRGLELHEDEMIIDLFRTQNNLMVTTNKGKYTVQVLVGGDGALSTVRKKMMPFQKRHLAPTFQLIAPSDPDYDSEFNKRKTVVDLTPIKEGLQGYVWHVPCSNGKTDSIAHGIVDFRVWPDRPRPDMKKIFIRELRKRNIHQDPKTWSSHPIPWYSEDDILSQPNVILVGDAAGIEPAFGGGIHLSLAYGEVAAQSIIDAFRTGDFSFQDYTQRIQSHQVGQHISKCTRIARAMYGGKMNPLDGAREVFAPEPDSSTMMRELLSRYLELHPQSSSDPE